MDTNAFALLLTDAPHLPAAARAFVSSSSLVSVSAISFYEIGQKVRLGKWDTMQAYSASLEEHAASVGYDVLSISAATALAASRMDWVHRDPFDRIIAAQALSLDVPLVSSDRAFDDLNLSRIWMKSSK
ncbi:MAG: type II toxin-antitoxin system VapC family toxin [Pseudomonadota bacterium]